MTRETGTIRRNAWHDPGSPTRRGSDAVSLRPARLATVIGTSCPAACIERGTFSAKHLSADTDGAFAGPKLYTLALQSLCQQLNAMFPRLPETYYRLRFFVKSNPFGELPRKEVALGASRQFFGRFGTGGSPGLSTRWTALVVNLFAEETCVHFTKIAAHRDPQSERGKRLDLLAYASGYEWSGQTPFRSVVSLSILCSKRNIGTKPIRRFPF